MKLTLSTMDRTVGVQGCARIGKTAMLDRAPRLVAKMGWRVGGLAPSISAVRKLAAEADIPSEIGFARGDRRRVARVDCRANEILLDHGRGGTVAWKLDKSEGAGAAARFIGWSRSSCALATASAGPATTPGSGWSTVTPQR